MTDLPKHLKVGYRHYEIIETVSALNDGEHDPHRSLILIRKDMDEVKQAVSLVHESLHAAYLNGDLAPEDSEEKVVTVLANQIAQIWRDNPDFVAFISGALK